jgi:hypothetical protein
MVKIVDSEEEVESVVTPNPARAAARLPHAQLKPKMCNQESKKIRAKREAQAKAKVIEVGASNSSRSTSNSSTNSRQLPDFMVSAWTTTFLPTIYQSLGCSEKPFSHYCKGPEIIGKLQVAVDMVWPGTDYQVTWGDHPSLKVSLACY